MNSLTKRYWDGSFVRHGNADPAKVTLPVQNISYTYNDFLELTTVTKTDKDGATKYTYSYDNAGNITSEIVEKGPDIKHLTQVESHGYGYDEDSVWKDKLTEYDAKGIEYDNGGKPVKYLGKSMKWNSINDCLMSVKESGKQDINYSYLSDGKRYTKTIAGKTKTYFYNNGIMLSERTDTERINFYYDSDGAVVELGVQTRVSKDRDWGSENRYFLVRNGQSDVVAIYRNDTSVLVGTYEYDPWGKVLSVKYAEN